MSSNAARVEEVEDQARNKTRKLRRQGGNAASPAERFFETLQGSHNWCCYGAEGTRHALELYAVDELLVSSEGAPGGLTASQWTSLAFNFKVVVVHVVTADTAAGNRFCSGFGIAGILARSIEPQIEDAVHFDYHVVVLERSSSRADKCQAENCVAVDRHVDVEYSSSSSDLLAMLSQQSPAHYTFFSWLAEALETEMASDSVSFLSLLDGVFVILTFPLEDQVVDFEDRLDDSEAILIESAPATSSVLRSRWYAAHSS